MMAKQKLPCDYNILAWLAVDDAIHDDDPSRLIGILERMIKQHKAGLELLKQVVALWHHPPEEVLSEIKECIRKCER